MPDRRNRTGARGRTVALCVRLVRDTSGCFSSDIGMGRDRLISMTLTTADLPVLVDDGLVGPRAERLRRRTFTADYKAAIVAEYDDADAGARGAILRREGLYSSHVVEWRKARDAAALAGPAAAPRPSGRSPGQVEIERLTARAEHAERELAKTRAALEIVGTADALLGLISESADNETRSRPCSPRPWPSSPGWSRPRTRAPCSAGPVPPTTRPGDPNRRSPRRGRGPCR